MSPTAQERAVADLLGTLYEQVDHLPRPLLEALTPALAQAQREVEKDLRAWLAREDGAARFTTQRLRRSLLQVRRTMERIRKDIDPALMKGLRIGANAAGRLATGHVMLEMERFGAMFRSPVTATIALDEAAILARGKQLLVHRFKTSVTTYSREMRARIGAELAVSKLRGETIDELSTRLSSALSNVFRGERWRAERLARTETMHAYNVQHREGVAQLREHDDGIRMRWDAYFDRRTCLQCASLDGQLLDPATKGGRFESSWTTKSGAKLKGSHTVPPAHPNCRCVLVAWHATWNDDAFRHDGAARARAMEGRDLRNSASSARNPAKPGTAPSKFEASKLTPRMRDYLQQAQRGPVSGIGNRVNQKALEERGLVRLERDPTTRDPNARRAVITDKGRALLEQLRSPKTTTDLQSLPSRPRTMRAAGVPLGFERPRTDGAPIPIVRGLPAFGQVNEDGLYAVPIGELRRAGLFALPGGGKDPKRMARIASDWRAGKRYDRLSLTMGADGRLIADDGRHRLLTALRGGKGIPRVMLVRIERAAPGAFEGLVRLQ